MGAGSFTGSGTIGWVEPALMRASTFMGGVSGEGLALLRAAKQLSHPKLDER